MATNQTITFVRHVRRAVLLEDGAGLTDGQLLGCFIEGRDEAAFAALVKRHGPMVWGVCRRLLNHHDAEDAFQAAFLVLVRKAVSIQPREMVANWLYGVAHQTALQARRTAARRAARERQVREMPDPGAVPPDLASDLLPLLDQELSRLPEKYRVLIVLCDLEGKPRAEVARQLGCPEGTVAGRLARARTLLAKRLGQQGAVLSGGALAAVLSGNRASAGVPTAVMSATIQAAAAVTAGQTVAGLTSVQVAALTEGVLKAMLLTKLKIATAVVLALAALAAGAWVVGSLAAPATAAAPQPPASAGVKPGAEVRATLLTAAEKTSADHARTDDEPINHVWITQKNVQEELRLTKAQVNKIQAIRQQVYKKYEAELKKAQAEMKKLNFASLNKLSRKIQDEERQAFAAAAPKLLSAGALKRVQQIQRQARGPHLIREPAIKKKLNLNDEQLRQIEGFLKEGAAKAHKEFARRNRGRGFAPLPLEDHIAITQKAYADAMKKVLGVLTREQRRTWNDLVGEPFAFKMPDAKTP
jgi:RNA polymerase sigma factor (sigma-70 family)